MEDFDGGYQRYFPQVYRYLCALCRDSGLVEELAQEPLCRPWSILSASGGSARCTLGCVRSEKTSTGTG